MDRRGVTKAGGGGGGLFYPFDIVSRSSVLIKAMVQIS